jgi:hypothetical protein
LLGGYVGILYVVVFHASDPTLDGVPFAAAVVGGLTGFAGLPWLIASKVGLFR